MAQRNEIGTVGTGTAAERMARSLGGRLAQLAGRVAGLSKKNSLATKLAIGGALLASAAGSAIAGPEGQVVVVGDVTFTREGNYWRITASDGAIIDYISFDILPFETVQFLQPGSWARVLNRINSAMPTQIHGTLLANGNVFFVNPSGVIFGGGAVINVGGVYAAAGNLSNEDFAAGNYNFTNLSGSVINHGSITAQNNVALVGQYVANTGQIVSNNGAVVMTAGKDVLLSEAGSTVTARITGGNALGAGAVGVENTGTINAGAQGRVLMAAGDVYSVAIRNRGTVRAGNIELNGGNTGIVDVGGTLDASNHSGQGGTIKVLGEKVGLFGATLNASGTGGGGEILIGGNERGAGPEANSQFVYISQDSVVRADGIGYGNGGRVIVFGEQVARIYGTLGAQGGEFGGNGGFVETSGKQFLEVAANIQIGARNGVAGEYLVDPLDITVVRNADGDNAVSGNPFTPTGASSRITVGTILTALAGGNVTITTVGTVGAGTGTITWNANAILDISTISAALNRTLTLSTDPGGSILFNGVMSNTGNAGRVGLILTAGAGGNVTFNGVANTGGGVFTVNTDSVATIAGNISTRGGAFSINGATTVDVQSSAVIDTTETASVAGNVSITGTTGLTTLTGLFNIGVGSMNVSGAGNVNLNGGSITGTGAGTISLASTGGTLTIGSGSAGSISGGDKTITLNASTGMTLNRQITGGSITATTTNGDLTINNVAAQTLRARVGNLSLNATAGAINVANGTTIQADAGTVDLNAGTNITFNGSTTLQGTGINVTAGAAGDIQVNNAAVLTLNAGTSGISTLTAADIDIASSATTAITGTGSLVLRPAAAGSNIILGNAGAGFNLTSAEIAKIAGSSAFSLLTIGRTDLTGSITVDNALVYAGNLLLQGDATLATANQIRLGGNLTVESVDLFGNVRLDAANVTISASRNSLSAASPAVRFRGIVEALADNTQGLTISAANGVAQFDNFVGNTNRLASLSVTAARTELSTVAASGANRTVRTGGNISFSNAVTLRSNSIVEATGGSSTVTFNGRVLGDSNGTRSLEVRADGTTTFASDVGFNGADSTNQLASLTTRGSSAAGVGTVVFGGVNPMEVRTSGIQTYQNAVELAQNTTFRSTSSGDLTFNSTIVSRTSGQQRAMTALTDGTILFLESIGDVVGRELLSLTTGGVTTAATGTTQFGNDVGGGFSVTVRTTQTQNYQNAITVGDNLVLRSLGAGANGAITLGGAVAASTNDAYSLSTFSDGTVSFLGNLATGGQLLQSVATAGNSAASAGDVVFGTGTGTFLLSTTGTQTFNNLIRIASNSTIQSFGAAAAGNISFLGGVRSAAASTPRSLGVIAANGATTITMAGTIGGGAGDNLELSSLSLSGQTIVLGSGGNDVSVRTTGGQTFTGDVKLNGNTTLTSTTNGNITLTATVGSESAVAADARSLTINTGGSTIFNDLVGAGTDASANAVNALLSLTTDAGGMTQFGNVAGTAANPTVRTLQGQSYGDTVLLRTDSVFVSEGNATNGNISFLGNVVSNGTARALEVRADGITLFGANVGVVDPTVVVVGDRLASLTTRGFSAATAGTTQLGDGGNTTIQSEGLVDFQNAVTVAGAATDLVTIVAFGGSNVNFAGTVNGLTAGAGNLVVNSDGTTTFNADVGGTNSLGSLATAGQAAATNGTVVFGNGGAGDARNVITAGTQTYQNAVTIADNLLFRSTGTGAAGNITFANIASDGDGNSRTLEVRSDGTIRFAADVGAVGNDFLTVTTRGDSAATAGTTAFGDTGSTNEARAIRALQALSFQNNVVVADQVTITTLGDATTGNITFGGTVNADATANNRSLTTVADGLVTFTGAVGAAGTFLQTLTTQGRTAATGGNVLLSADVTTSGLQDYQNNLQLGAATITLTAGDLNFGNTVTGTAAGRTLNIAQFDPTTAGIALGGAAPTAGQLSLTSAELLQIGTNVAQVNIGQSTFTGANTVSVVGNIGSAGTGFAPNLTLTSNNNIALGGDIFATQLLNLNGNTAVTGSRLLSVGDLNIGGNVTGAGANLAIQAFSNTATIVLGATGAAGTLSLDATELGRLGADLAGVTIGRADMTGTSLIDVQGAFTTPALLTLTSGSQNIRLGANIAAGALTTTQTTGTTILAGGDRTITTTGAALFGGAIVTDGTARGLTVTATGGATFGKDVGTAGARLGQLLVNGGGITTFGSNDVAAASVNVFATGIDVGTAVEVFRSTSLDAGGGRLWLRSTTNAAAGAASKDLTLVSTFSDPTFALPAIALGGSLGTTRALGNVTLGSTIATPQIATIVFGVFDPATGRLITASNLTPGARSFSIISDGNITMAAGQKILALGNLTLQGGGTVTVGDLASLGNLTVQGTNIVIRLREANTIVNNIGQPFADIGTDFVAAGTITFTGAISTTGAGAFAYASDLGNNVAALDAAGGQLFIPTEPNAIVDSFFDPATLNARLLVLDLRAQGGTRASTVFTPPIPRLQDEGRVSPSVVASDRIRELLKQIGIDTKSLSGERILQFLIGRALYNDRLGMYTLGSDGQAVDSDTPRPGFNPSRPNLGAGGDVRVSINRLSLDVVERVIEAYVGAKLNDSTHQEIVKAKLGEAWTRYSATGGAASGTGFRSFLEGSSDAGDQEALGYLQDIGRFFGELDRIGLTAKETSVPKNVLIDAIAPAEIDAEQVRPVLLEAIQGTVPAAPGMFSLNQITGPIAMAGR